MILISARSWPLLAFACGLVMLPLVTGCPPDHHTSCKLDQNSLNFESVLVGQTRDLPFKITNEGETVLAGTLRVTGTNSPFSIAGGSSYSLDPGDTLSVTVHFAPTTAGLATATISTGLTACGTVSASGVGVIPNDNPPGPITDLQVDAATSSTCLMLRWTAVGGDGTVGRAARYEIRKSTVLETWDQMDVVSNDLVPREAGGQESLEICDLNPDATYYFRIRACDAQTCGDFASQPASGRTLGCVPGASIRSTFDSGDEGFRVLGGDFSSETPPVWTASGGSPDGCVSATGGNSHDWYWVLPQAYRGNLCAAYGHTLSFDLNQDNTNLNCQETPKMVIVEGGGLLMYMDGTYVPDMAWTSYACLFDETAQWKIGTTNQRASASQIKAVLANVSRIRIRGGWLVNCGSSTAGLDNVLLQLNDAVAPPSPLPIAESFDAGVSGWTVAGGTFGRFGSPVWTATGGSAGGPCISATGGAAGLYRGWFWLAPPRFLGKLSAAYGRSLRFTLKQDKDNLNCQSLVKDMVVLEGGGFRICYPAPVKVGTAWTSFTVPLDASAQWYLSGKYIPSSTRASEAQIRSVLANLAQLKIRGGWIGATCGQGSSGLDEVILGD